MVVHPLFGAAALVSVVLVHAPPTASEDPAGADEHSDGANAAGDSGAPDPAVAASRRAFELGTTMYETQRFDEAIEAFTEAFTQSAEIEDEELRLRSSSTMLFNLARAQLGAYGVDQNIEHLRQAERLMLKYRQGEREAGRDPDSDGDMRRLEREIAAAMDAYEDEEARNGTSDRGNGPNRRLLWAGVGTMAASTVGFGVMAGGMIMGSTAERDYLDEPSGTGRSDLDQRGRTGNLMAVVGGATAGTLVLVGGALIGVAYKRGERGPASQTDNQVRVSPALGRDGAGVVLRGRF